MGPGACRLVSLECLMQSIPTSVEGKGDRFPVAVLVCTDAGRLAGPGGKHCSLECSTASILVQLELFHSWNVSKLSLCQQ